ncbi:MAG TPA: glycosyltransferase family 2 protein [Candidatus Acidoferrum sp.]|nr:glycosyltransferase family 2 protein [Candidatus Acidoferrum sp.]
MKPQTVEAFSASEVATIGLGPKAKAETLPYVTVVVPCRNEEKHIVRCLESILANDYPKERLEILVVDGMSEDGTRAVVKSYGERHGMIRLVDNPEKHIPVAMNLGIRNARGETIIKMDAHSTYQEDHISLCVAYQEKYEAENVGGVCKMAPGADTAVARAIVAGLGHRFGSGNAGIKVGVEKPTWSDTAAFGCFQKELFTRVGYFDERLLSSSDMDMNQRIRAAGGGILLVPEIVIRYCADGDLRSFWRHNFADGVWATYVLKFGSKGWSWRHWAPLGLVMSVLAPLALSVVYPKSWWVSAIIAGIYAMSSLLVSTQIGRREKDAVLLPLLPLIFGIRHLAHGLGAWFGLLLAILPGYHWKSRRGMRA